MKVVVTKPFIREKDLSKTYNVGDEIIISKGDFDNYLHEYTKEIKNKDGKPENQETK